MKDLKKTFLCDFNLDFLLLCSSLRVFSVNPRKEKILPAENNIKPVR